jgi:hypothetical protein
MFAPAPMQQVIPLLWIGDINAVYDVEALQKNGIRSVLSALNGDIEVHSVRVMSAEEDQPESPESELLDSVPSPCSYRR